MRTTVRIRVDAGRSCDYHLPVRLYRVVMRSGANMDVTAKLMLDDPTVSDSILFYQDETQHHLVATVVRSEVAGLILFPQKSTVTGRL